MSDAKLSATEARKLAVEYVTDCIGQAEADGYQQSEDAGAPWIEHNPSYSAVTPRSFVVTIGGRHVRFTATVEREGK